MITPPRTLCLPTAFVGGLDIGAIFPACVLRSTGGLLVDLGDLRGRAYLLFYAIALPKDISISDELDSAFAIRSGTDMLLFFNQALPLLKRLGIDVYGISVQTTGIQMTSAERLGLRFPLLSDARCALAEAIKLPMTLQGRRKRFPVLAVELRNGVIRRILDPEQLVVASR